MSFKKNMKKVKKRLDYKFIVIGILVALAIPMLVKGNFFMQSEWGVAHDKASFYIAGVEYAGHNYYTTNDISNSGGRAISWNNPNIKYFDPDGNLPDTTIMSTTDRLNYYSPVKNIQDLDGILPAVKFDIGSSLQLVDAQGNDLDSGYSQKDKTQEGYDRYYYFLKFTLTIDITTEKLPGTPTTEELQTLLPGGLLTYLKAEYAKFKTDGYTVETYGLVEGGVLDATYALLACEFPDIEGWKFGWVISVDDVGESFTSSQTGESIPTTEMENYLEDVTPRLGPIYEDYVFVLNENNAIQRSHSGNGEISPIDDGDKSIGSIGIRSGGIPITYHAAYKGWGFKDLAVMWDVLQPKLTYDLTLKVSAIDTNSGEDDGFNPDIGFKWPSFGEIGTTETILISGGAFTGIMVIGLIAKKRSELAGGAYY